MPTPTNVPREQQRRRLKVPAEEKELVVAQPDQWQPLQVVKQPHTPSPSASRGRRGPGLNNDFCTLIRDDQRRQYVDDQTSEIMGAMHARRVTMGKLQQRVSKHV